MFPEIYTRYFRPIFLDGSTSADARQSCKLDEIKTNMFTQLLGSNVACDLDLQTALAEPSCSF